MRNYIECNEPVEVEIMGQGDGEERACKNLSRASFVFSTLVVSSTLMGDSAGSELLIKLLGPAHVGMQLYPPHPTVLREYM